jgi:hypothetical protein
VVLTLSWPSSLDTSSIGTPLLSKSTANVSRSRCDRMCPSDSIPAALNSFRMSSCQCMTVLDARPLPVQKTYLGFTLLYVTDFMRDFWCLRLEARVRIELTIEVLQTSALPLGYRAR